MKKRKQLIALLFAAALGMAQLAGCGTSSDNTQSGYVSSGISESSESEPELTENNTETQEDIQEGTTVSSGSFPLDSIPEYSGSPYVEVNGNVPFFTDDEIAGASSSYEYYPVLDSRGRCGTCTASVGIDIMPTEDRGEIGSVKPSGWHTVKYNGIVDGNYLSD